MSARRIAVALLLVATTLSAAPEKWYDAYNRGIAAVNAKNYKAAADALQSAIAQSPAESTAVRAKNEIITYVPHFWLGIAKFNLGDVDGALREWRTSEDQGAIAKTEYYARLRDWVARAQTEKQRMAQNAVAGPRKAADTAISRALTTQVDALSAGGDRSDSYRGAQRKLQDALNTFHNAGNDAAKYKQAEDTAQQAIALFSAAADEAKRLKAARPAVVAQAKPPAVQEQRMIAAPVPQPAPQVTQPAPQPTVPPAATNAEPPAPVISEAEAAAQVAAQQARRAALEKKNIPFPPAGPAASAVVPVTTPSAAPLRDAYRAFASGDLVLAEQLLSGNGSAEGLLLRGCTRYTRAMLSRSPQQLVASAADDFRAALQRNRALRLDPKAFSPKLVAFFEQVRAGR